MLMKFEICLEQHPVFHKLFIDKVKFNRNHIRAIVQKKKMYSLTTLKLINYIFTKH